MNSMGGPSDRDNLLNEARNLRLARRIPEALTKLAQLEALHPNFSRLFQERGHCYVTLGDAPSAITALGEALRLNPTLPASWDMLAQLYRLAGETDLANAAADNLAALERLPRAVVVANTLYADGDLTLADQVLVDYLKQDRGNVGALRMLARIRTALGDPKAAEALLIAALDQAPDFHQARFDYALILQQQQKYAQARAMSERLLAHDPTHRDYLKQYALACIGLGDYAAVIDVYGRLLDAPNLSGTEIADLRLWRANALKVTGRLEKAITDYHAALDARPNNGVAWFSLANLKTYRFGDADISRMRAAEAEPPKDDQDRVYLCFALGKALEDNGDYAASWEYYERGNAIRCRTRRDQPDVADACVRKLKSTFTAEVFKERAGFGLPDTSPIFVLGLPRSGSTLLEQILASHAQVEGTQELVEMNRYVTEICGQDPDCHLPLAPDALLRLTTEDARALGERYIAETRPYRHLGRPYFIDKMPHNFWHIGLIHLILPKATIIDMRRDPMACCFGNFKQLFGGSTQEYSYGLDSVARRYRAYLDLMRHWDEVLPGRVLRMQHEDVVQDLDGSIQRLLDHCGLPFDPACLTFHETRRSVRTPSSEQVRQPIRQDGLTRWRHYEPWLAPLRIALGDALIRYKD